MKKAIPCIHNAKGLLFVLHAISAFQQSEKLFIFKPGKIF